VNIYEHASTDIKFIFFLSHLFYYKIHSFMYTYWEGGDWGEKIEIIQASTLKTQHPHIIFHMYTWQIFKMFNNNVPEGKY